MRHGIDFTSEQVVQLLNWKYGINHPKYLTNNGTNDFAEILLREWYYVASLGDKKSEETKHLADRDFDFAIGACIKEIKGNPELSGDNLANKWIDCLDYLKESLGLVPSI